MWTEFHGKTPIALSELTNGSPKLYEGAWFMRQSGILYTAPAGRPVGLGAVSARGRVNLNNAAMNRQIAGAQVGVGAITDTAAAMVNALSTNGYRMADMPIYQAFQTDAGLTADGFPGTSTMNALQQVVGAAGMPNVTIYPWKNPPGTYDGVNAPPLSQWNPSAAGTTPAPSGNTVTNNSTTNSTTTSTTMPTWEPWAIGAAVIAGAGIIGMSVLHKGGLKGAHGAAKRHLSGAHRKMRSFSRKHA
jgi:hypothetical protein